MRVSRNQILTAVIVLIVGFGIWRFFAGDGTITVDFTNAPLSKVISAFKWQGHVNIATNIDPNTPVTIKLDHAPLYDSLDTLSVRVDGNVRLAYIGAPTKQQINAAVQAYEGSLISNDWKVYNNPMGNMIADGEDSFDPRKPVISVTADASSSFQSVLDQLVQKSGAMAAIPSDWNPDLKKVDISGSVHRLFPKLAGIAHGRMQEYFLITGQPHRDASAQGFGGQQEEIIGVRAGGQPNPDWMDAHGVAIVKSLPPDRQADAQSQLDTARSFRKMTPDQRRAMMNDPAFQDRMMQRMEARMDKMSPQQRSQRIAGYVARKAAAGVGPH